MSLENLLGRSLDRVAPERNVADAQLAGLSAENKFDAAYKSIMHGV